MANELIEQKTNPRDCELCGLSARGGVHWCPKPESNKTVKEELKEAYDDPRGDIMWRAGIARAEYIINSHAGINKKLIKEFLEQPDIAEAWEEFKRENSQYGAGA